MLLNDDELNKLNTETQKTSNIMKLDVYPMKVEKIEAMETKNGKCIRIWFDTYFKKEDGEKRMINTLFPIEGNNADGKPKIQALARFLHDAFKIVNVTNQTLESIVGKKLAVALKRDTNGYLAFYYAGVFENLDKMRKRYVPKDESNGLRPNGQNANTPNPQAEPEQPKTGSEPKPLPKAVAGEESDDIPF